jgi:hypothetical protein
MISGFHPNAKVRWDTGECMDLNTFIEAAIKIQSHRQPRSKISWATSSSNRMASDRSIL